MTPEQARLGALVRFSIAITILNLLGHTVLGFEISVMQMLVCVTLGYLIEIVLESAEHVPRDADVAGFRAGIIELVGSAYRRTAGEFRLAPFAARLFDLQRRSGITAAPQFVFPLLSLLVLEGMINEFDVDVDFQAEAIPILLAVLRS